MRRKASGACWLVVSFSLGGWEGCRISIHLVIMRAHYVPEPVSSAGASPSPFEVDSKGRRQII